MLQGAIIGGLVGLIIFFVKHYKEKNQKNDSDLLDDRTNDNEIDKQ